MKKIISILITAAALLSFSGCSIEVNVNPDKQNDANEATASPNTVETAQTPTPIPASNITTVTPTPDNSTENPGVPYGYVEEFGNINAGDTLFVVLCDEFVTLRSQPSTKASESAKIPLWSSVVFRADMQNGFFKVTYRDKTGYVLKKYLDAYEPQVLRNNAKIVNCENFVSLRAAANTKTEAITTIPLGAEITVTFADERNGFSHVFYNGLAGWVLSEYIEIKQ